METDEFFADVALITYEGSDGSSTGSGRLIAPGLVLTAGHVVAVPTASPAVEGWAVRLERDNEGSSWPPYKAKRVWPQRLGAGPDLALLEIVKDKPSPFVELTFALHTTTNVMQQAKAGGFPQGKWDEARHVQKYLPYGDLSNAGGAANPFIWSIPDAMRPDNAEQWKGLSG